MTRLPRVSQFRWLIVVLTTAGWFVLCQSPFGAWAQPEETHVEPDRSTGVDQSTAPDQTMGAPDFASPRDRLDWHGVDESNLARLTDGRPLDRGENEPLMLLMYHYRRFPMTDVEGWAQPAFDSARVAEQAGASRGLIYRLSGRVTRVEVLKPLPELVDRFELKRYYRCEMLLGAQEQPAVIFSHDVPQAWLEDDKLDRRAGVLGMFLKFAAQQSAQHQQPAQSQQPALSRPVFVARRIGWYPKTLLGNLRMDVSLMDDVTNRTPLSGLDRECFYQMLAAAGRAKPGQLLREAERQLEQAGKDLKRLDDDGNEQYSVVPLFNDPDRQRGRLFALEGIARRVVRIRVEDPDIVERFGIDHYYNLFVFTDDSQSNPIVFCVRQLPEGMTIGDGTNFGERVRVAGFFLKTWAYRVQRPPEGVAGESGGAKRCQLAPLLIGREPVWYPAEPPASSAVAGAIAGGLFVLAMLGIWLALWHYGRRDKQFRDGTIARTLAPPSDVSLEEIVRASEQSAHDDQV